MLSNKFIGTHILIYVDLPYINICPSIEYVHRLVIIMSRKKKKNDATTKGLQ